MTDTVQAIEAEIVKIEARIDALKKENPAVAQDQKVQAATISLLKDVVKDLRKQQKKLTVPGADRVGKKMLKMNEIFYSIQGESSFAGRPCVFVRLTGCNLRCLYCDTMYAYEEGKETSVEKIVQAVASYDCRLVEVTGGEPLLQEETSTLIDRLLKERYTVLLETNGSCDIGLVNDQCIRIVDFKCPGSGMEGSNRLDNIDALSPHDEVKFVIGDRRDFDFAMKVTEAVRAKHGQTIVIHFAPVFGTLAPESLAEWILEENVPVRLQLQLHKVIWPTIERGV